ncbi:DUF6233 domain-containing protein [Streptomyces deserti]
MDDLPPDLYRLRTLETWLVLTLERVRRQIADAERREAERQRGIAARPPAPEWLIDLGLTGRDPLYVRVGDCWAAGQWLRGIGREQAWRALADGVKACPHCQPDNALGFLD